MGNHDDENFLNRMLFGNLCVPDGDVSEEKEISNESDIAEYIRGLDCDSIAYYVNYDELDKSLLSDITATCRRKFKGKDIIVYADLNPDVDFEKGMVFTEDKIVYWDDNGRNVIEIMYSDIMEVDYGDEDIIITSGENTNIFYLGEYAAEEQYPRHMYSFIMDILDYIRKE